MKPLIQTFVMHFGEMGSRWGINRTVSQIYALLFVSREPLHADAIVEALNVSRSNVSMGLKELQAWRLVETQMEPGDRRLYYRAPEDVWDIFRTLAEERQRREVDPTLSMLRSALLSEPACEDERHAQQRMEQMHEFIEMLTGWFAEVQRLSPQTLTRLMRLGSSVGRLLELADRGGRLPSPN
ncbi:MAG: GbsR/MarR family transcriptional regulator [Xanthomonadales bacterium]|nr:GbsR/MarR family transcriptional regulator [Xanthomonadales bacterium]